MIKIKVKTIWQGKIGIREKYLRQAQQSKEGISISVGRDVMEVPYEEIEDKIVAWSDKPVKDKFSGGFHNLFYFKWEPQSQQKNLL